MKFSIIIPTLNEAANIKILIPAIFKELNERNFELIIVDDGSKDKTKELLDNFKKKFKRIKTVYRKKKLGIGSAYREGALNSSGEIVLFMDGDLSHNPKYLIPILDEFEKKGTDLVIGSRYINGGNIVGWSAYRKLVSKTANNISRFILGIKINDLTSGYRAFKRNLLDKIAFNSIKSNGYSFILESNYCAWKNGAKIKEVPIAFMQRGEGKSKLGKREIIKYLFTIFRLKLIS